MPRVLAIVLAFGLLPTFLASPVAQVDQEKSALERDPDGWVDLLAGAGPGLKGWTRLPIPPEGKLKSETVSQWSLNPETGVLLCAGDGGHEWVRWDKEVSDAVFHVDWRFVPATGKRGSYNSGVYARNSADAKVWHQAQTGNGSGGFLFGESPAGGMLKRFDLSRQVKDKRVKPAGEWNTFELTAKGKVISLWVNGAETCAFDACGLPRGHVGLEAEGWAIEFRNVKLKALDP